jgi:hypothetical protein
MSREGGGIFSRATPTNDLIDPLVILHPHLSQDFYRRDLAEPLRGRWIKQGIKQLSSLLSDQIAQKPDARLPPQANANLRLPGP